MQEMYQIDPSRDLAGVQPPAGEFFQKWHLLFVFFAIFKYWFSKGAASGGSGFWKMTSLWAFKQFLFSSCDIHRLPSEKCSKNKIFARGCLKTKKQKNTRERQVLGGLHGWRQISCFERVAKADVTVHSILQRKYKNIRGSCRSVGSAPRTAARDLPCSRARGQHVVSS